MKIHHRYGGHNTSMIPLDSQFNLTLQNILGTGVLMKSIMDLLSMVGSVAFYTLLIAIIYWCVDTRLGTRLGIAFFIACNTYSLLKLVFHSPRPYWIDTNVKALSTESSFGFPSGHSHMAAAVWGMLGFKSKKGGWITGSLILIFLIGISRLYLGVHFLSDVLGGWTLGFLLLALMFALDKPVSKWANRTKPAVVFCVALAAGIAFLSIGYFFYSNLIPWQLPSNWNAKFQSSIQPVTMKDTVESAGIWIGFVGGICWLRSLTGIRPYKTTGTRSQLIWRCLVGIAGILFLYGSLGLITPHTDSVTAWLIRFLRSGLTGFWISGLAPYVFIKSGLTAEK
jgi:membrane-associated phospholipid phosphatase